MPLDALGLVPAVLLLIASAAVIAVAGTRLTRAADRLADVTGLGEALVGAVLLGAATSLAGVVVSFTAAAHGRPVLAVGNAIGGIAVQTAFLAIADILYRRSNLEHAAASFANLLQGLLLLGLLVLLLAVIPTPEVAFWGVHPVSPVILLAYLAGLRLASKAAEHPMWHPRDTEATVLDDPADGEVEQSLRRLVVTMLATGLLVGGAGYVVSICGSVIADRTVLSETLVGSLLLAVVTSLPELVVSVAAVRRGALTLAVGNVVGGNSFEVLVVAAADGAYRDGSLLHAITPDQHFAIALSALMMVIQLLGLLHRQRDGVAGIGWESFLNLLVFAAGYWLLYALGGG